MIFKLQKNKIKVYFNFTRHPS